MRSSRIDGDRSENFRLLKMLRQTSRNFGIEVYLSRNRLAKFVENTCASWAAAPAHARRRRYTCRGKLIRWCRMRNHPDAVSLDPVNNDMRTDQVSRVRSRQIVAPMAQCRIAGDGLQRAVEFVALRDQLVVPPGHLVNRLLTKSPV